MLKPKQISMFYIKFYIKEIIGTAFKTPAYWYCILLLSLVVDRSYAQKNNINDLRPIIEKIKTIKVYSYTTTTKAIFPNGKKEQLIAQTYMDRVNKKYAYKSTDQIVIVNKDWVFKVDHKNKSVGVYNIPAYYKKHKEPLAQINTIFEKDMTAFFMDSLVSKYGTLLSTAIKEQLTTYEIGFSPEAALKKMLLVYNTAKQLPESIFFKLESVLDSKGSKAITETTCNNYSTTVNNSVFEVSPYFSIVKGKVLLNQYKNYKVYSEL
jgi:hypothetical protein